MNRQAKQLFIILPLCILLAGTTVLLCLLDPEFDSYQIAACVLLSVWAFFITPSLLFTIGWARNYFGNPNFEQSFRWGYFWGTGGGVLVILLLVVVSPATGTIWFIQTVKALKQSVKNKRDRTTDETFMKDIFDL